MGITERKEREKLRRRNEIIDAAEKVFFSKGVENATMDDVAEAAEYSKGTLYIYFRNKEELLYAIKMRSTLKLKEEFRKSINPEANGIENVRNIGQAFIKYSHEHSDCFNLMMHFEGKNLDSLNFDDPFIKASFEEHEPMILFIDLVKKGQEEGSIRDDFPAHIITHSIWAMTVGVLQMITMQKQILAMQGFSGQEDQFVEGMFAIIERGIEKIDQS